nr:SIMPL domain-containing protein [Anaerolineae bacterium]
MKRTITILMVAGLLVGVLAVGVGCSGGAVGGSASDAALLRAYAAGSGVDGINAITVSGEGEAMGVPDVAYVTLGIETVDEDLGSALAEANRIMAAVQAAVSGQGVEDRDMRTQNFNVWMETIREDNNNRPQGQVYHVTNALRVTVRAIDTAGDVIGAALDAGANTISGLSFGIDDTSALEQEARAAAVAEAVAKAEQLAEALGIEVGAPVSVSESYVSIPVVREAYGYDMAFTESAAPPISEGELTISVSVNVSFAIKD